jgi:hypothetical protein
MKKLLVLCSVLALSASSFAATITGSGGYKSAGCGLGSMIIKDDGFVQIFAATTNGTAGTQTFGITSGTSNCTGSGGYAKVDAEKQMYMEANLDNISQEMAQGSGEHLDALASLVGCQNGNEAQFAATMKKNYASFSGEKSPLGMLEKVKATVSADPALSKVCSI